ncbi:MAG: inositol monophosphatase family protein [Deltaproteobacteria bacterium]|nr:inositol monophosphatase family protein [Deltaproteobacteria bacterium]
MNYESERFVAVQAVLKACLLCQSVQASLVSEETMSKRDNSPVTVADFGAQAVISLELMRAFPNGPITAEEDAADLRISKNANVKEKVLYHVNAVLLRGEQYAIALALIEKGEVVLGVLGCPNLPVHANRPDEAKGCLFIAVKRQGANIRSFDDPTEIQINVANIGDPSMASFCESVESAHSSHSDAALITEILGVTAPPVRIDSQCKYAVIARGDASIYLRLPTRADYVEKIWDHAAGWLIVKEAGGEVTDVYGHPLDFSVGRGLDRNKGIVGTNGKLHSQVIAAVRQVLKPEKR